MRPTNPFDVVVTANLRVLLQALAALPAADELNDLVRALGRSEAAGQFNAKGVPRQRAGHPGTRERHHQGVQPAVELGIRVRRAVRFGKERRARPHTTCAGSLQLDVPYRTSSRPV